ncbi:MAG: acetolactate synthase small subunit [Odoribacter sp.]|nr:acetolactate synthase small subunit [Odoribacter sp.]
MNNPQYQLFTVTIYSENSVGLLNRVSNIFTRRCLNIEDVTASVSSVPDIHKLTLTTWSDRPTMEKVVGQLEKIIEVIKVGLYTDDDIVYQEIALYKVPTAGLLQGREFETIIRSHGARVLEMTPEFTVIEKTGHSWETEALFDCLRRYDIRQFVRSGRVSVTNSPVEHIDLFLQQQNQRKKQLESNE